MTIGRPLATHAVLASFAAAVSPSVQGAIHEIEDLAMAAQADQAIEAARATASQLPDGVPGDDDRIAVGEVVAFVAARWASSRGPAMPGAARSPWRRCAGPPRARVPPAGADRSLAAVLRDRTLHRGSSLEAIPDQLKGVVTGALTRREHEVAVLAAKGLTAKEIAAELSISVWTARHQLQRVREKLGGVPKRKLGQLLAEPDSFL